MPGIQAVLDQHEDLREFLFIRGFLVTDDPDVPGDGYPFYGSWICERHGSFFFWRHPKTWFHTFAAEGKTFFLFGHAYNPFTMEYEEACILEKLANAWLASREEFVRLCNELTGIFLLGVADGHDLTVLLDASGMQYACYGCVSGNTYVSSHMRLIGDLCGLQVDGYVSRLVGYRWYHFMMGNYLPGDLSCYRELKRIVPNTIVSGGPSGWSIERFYPNREIAMCQTEEEYRAVIAEACRIMRNTMELIPKKWARPAISLTGGIDSNTTFAAANGIYDQYETFSYISMHRESVDAECAARISERFHVVHKEYQVPETNEEATDFDAFKAIFEYNHGGIGSSSDSDTRKKITLIRSDVCDVEVKSWISETIRAYAYKYFGRRHFPRSLSPRNYTSLYKIFVLNRRLAIETDGYFKEYLDKTKLKEHIFNYDESDFFVWEMMHGGKCGLDIGVMKACFDITIPYNNRNLLDLLLRVPLEDRLADRHHLDMKKEMNPELYDMNIRVVNLNETDRRKRLANLYYTVNSILPY